MAEIDLPAGAANDGGAQLGKFLSTLSRLVEILGQVGPGASSGGSESSGGGNGGQALVKATQKLFNDMASAFKPLKTVLASFGSLQGGTPASAAAPAAFLDSSPASVPAPAEAPNIQNPKYNKYFKADPFDSMRASSTPKTSITSAAIPATVAPESGSKIIQVQDASVGIEQATVRMKGGSTSPSPKATAIPASAIHITTASVQVAQGLFQGQLMLPPDLKLDTQQITLTAQQVHVYGNQQDKKSPETPSKPESTSATSSSGGGGNKFASLFSALAKGMQEAARNLATGALDAGKKMAALVGSGVAAPVNAAPRVVGNVGEKLTMAFNDPIGAIQSFSRLMIGFIEVVNPAAVMQFNKAIKDITAIIGIVLAPAMTILTEVAREFGNLMVPVAKQIAPIFTELARTIGDLLMAQIRTFATYLQVLMPIIKSLMIIFGGLARIATAISEGFMVFLSGFLGSFNGLDDVVRKVVDGIVDFVKMMVRYTLVAVAMVAKLFGATDFIEKMRKAAAGKGPEKEDSTGLANPTNASFTAAESFGKNIATASFTATSAATAPKKTDDFLEDIAKDMEAIAGMDMKQTIIEAIEASVPALARAIAGGTVETIKSAGSTAYEYTGLPWAGRKLGNFAAGLMGYETD